MLIKNQPGYIGAFFTITPNLITQMCAKTHRTLHLVPSARTLSVCTKQQKKALWLIRRTPPAGLLWNVAKLQRNATPGASRMGRPGRQNNCVKVRKNWTLWANNWAISPWISVASIFIDRVENSFRNFFLYLNTPCNLGTLALGGCCW